MSNGYPRTVGEQGPGDVRASLHDGVRKLAVGLQQAQERVSGALGSVAGRLKENDTGARLTLALQTLPTSASVAASRFTCIPKRRKNMRWGERKPRRVQATGDSRCVLTLTLHSNRTWRGAT